jgi:hypothetical protein
LAHIPLHSENAGLLIVAMYGRSMVVGPFKESWMAVEFGPTQIQTMTGPTGPKTIFCQRDL